MMAPSSLRSPVSMTFLRISRVMHSLVMCMLFCLSSPTVMLVPLVVSKVFMLMFPMFLKIMPRFFSVSRTAAIYLTVCLLTFALNLAMISTSFSPLSARLIGFLLSVSILSLLVLSLLVLL